jgi:WhiB family transcriptional regulator, redox-sensing transcriptional regulator
MMPHPVSEIEYSDFLEVLMVSAECLPDVDDFLKRPEWQQQAACRGVGTAGFFPAPQHAGLRQARRLCARCPVSEECLDFALDNPSLKGVWAGTTERRRRKLRAASSLDRDPQALNPLDHERPGRAN